MKIGSFEIPPRNKGKNESAEEYVPAEKPEALPNGVAHEAPEELEAAISTYISAWNQYAAEHNVFISEEKQALWKAAREAKELSDELHATENPNEKKKCEAKLVAKIKKISGPLSKALEKRIEANKERLAGQAAEADGAPGSAENTLDLKDAERLDPEEATPKENKNVLEANISEIEEISASGAPKSWENLKEQAPAERAAMDAAEAAYLEKYREYYRQKGAKEKNEPEELAQLKDEFDKARIAYGTAITERARQELDTRGMKPGVEGENKKYTKEDVLARYNRLVRYNAIIKPAAEKRYEARLEAMGQREQGTFMKGLAWVGRQNKKLEDRFGKNGARFVRAAATTVAVGGGAAAVGAFGTAGLLGALGWGTYRFGRSLVSSFAGAGLGEAAAQAYGGFRKGKLERRGAEAADELKDKKWRIDKVLTIEDLEALDTQRMKLREESDETAIKRKLEKEKMLVRALTAFGVGAGTSAALAHLPSGVSGAAEIAQNAASEPASAGSHEGIATEHAVNTPATHAANAPEAASVAPAPDHTETPIAAEIVDQPGEGTDHLIADLKANIEQNGLFKGQESPALKHFLETHPDTLSREMGDIYGERGMVTHAGDQFFVDEHQNVYFQPKGGDAEIFIENKPDGAGHEFTIHKKFTGQPLAPAAEAPEAASVPAPEHALEQPAESAAAPSPEAAAPVSEGAAAGADAFPRNPYLTTPDETVYAETAPAEAAPAPADTDAFPKNPYLTPKSMYVPESDTPAQPAGVPAAPASEMPSAEPSPAPEAASIPEPTRHMPDGYGNMVEVPPESAFTLHPEGEPGVGRTPGMMYPEGTPVPDAPVGDPTHGVPVESAPAPAEPAETPAVPAEVPHEANGAPAMMNPNGFNLAENHVGIDSNGNAFAHTVDTGSVETNNEAAYQAALEYSRAHPGVPVYYVSEARMPIFDTVTKEVLALKFNPEVGDKFPVPYASDDGGLTLHKMPPIPPDAQLKNPTK